MEVIIGDLTIYQINTGNCRVDGGVCFGLVPKAIWSKHYSTDDVNRLYCGGWSAVVHSADGWAMLEGGLWHPKYDVKYCQLNAIEPNDKTISEQLRAIGLTENDIKYVFLTHLHWDHTAICTDDSGQYPRFPNAKYVTRRSELESYKSSNIRIKAGYFRSNFDVVWQSGLVEELEDGDIEYSSWISLLHTPGHTPGHQSFLLNNNGNKMIWWGDVAMTPLHLDPLFIPSVDQSPLTTLETKKKYLPVALAESWHHYFYHLDLPYQSAEAVSERLVKGIKRWD